MRSQTLQIIAAVLFVAICAELSVLLVSETHKTETKTFDIRARQYAYDPPVINVHRGDSVCIRLSSLDVVHGFYLEGYGIDAEIFPMKPLIRLRDPSQQDGFRDAEKIAFRADKVGKFRYRCSHTCGYLHPFMQGELVVGPNYPFRAAVGAAVGILFAGCFLFFVRIRRRGEHTSQHLDPEVRKMNSQDCRPYEAPK